MHCNSNKSSQPFGASVHILGPKSKNTKNQKDYFAASMSVAQRENSVMLLEDNYQTTYQDFDPDSPESIISHSLMWNANYSNSLLFAAEIDKVMNRSPFRISSYTGIHQDIFYLLWAIGAPSALLEVGFLSNPQDYAVLSTKEGQDKIAKTIFDAFKSYKMKYDASVGAVAQPAQIVKKKETVVETRSSDDIYYGIQIMGLGRKLKTDDPAFKGLKATAVKSDDSNIYKYITSPSSTKEAAAAQLTLVRKKFPEAFLVKVTGTKVERVR
jgi:N-acetylmuramoyl-L-alanine amidase